MVNVYETTKLQSQNKKNVLGMNHCNGELGLKVAVDNNSPNPNYYIIK